MPTMIDENTESLTEQIIGAAIEVHKELGPGLLESAYQRALAYEFKLHRISFEEQKLCPVIYKGLLIDKSCKLDFLVDQKIVVELKAVDALNNVHEAQVATYLRYSNCHIGLLFNFNTTLLTRELRRIVK